jgi:Tol biopolymer transport system component
VSHRVTLDPSDDVNPVWSRPTGDRIAFTTYRNGNADIYIKNANGTGDETPILNSSADELIEDWSKDGQYIAYKLGAEASADIWVLPMSGDKKPFPVVQGPYRKDEPQFSYDGKWLAYVSFESGDVPQVFVTSLPGHEQKIQVSRDGGGMPRWHQNGKELLFMSRDGQIMAVAIKPGPAVSADVPQVLFRLTVGNPTPRNPERHQMAVTPDGERFLVRVPPNAGAGSAAIIQFNFPGALAASTLASAQAQVSAGLTVIRNWPALSAATPPGRRP